MKIRSVSGNKIVIVPESVAESGLMQWLAERLDTELVTLEFGTLSEQFGALNERSSEGSYHFTPALFIDVPVDETSIKVTGRNK